MKVILVSLLGLLMVSSAALAQSDEQPNVSCWLIYNRVDAQGISVEYKDSEVITAAVGGTKVTIEGFTLNASLEKVCAADGGPCGGYRLTATVTKGEQSSFFTTALSSSAKEFTRYSSGLTSGAETAFVNCDLDNR